MAALMLRVWRTRMLATVSSSDRSTRPAKLPKGNHRAGRQGKGASHSAVATLVPDQQRARAPYEATCHISDWRRLDLELRLVVWAIRRTVCRSML